MEKNKAYDNSKGQKKNIVIRVFKEFVPIMFKIIPRETVLLGVLKILISLIPMLQIYIVKELIDVVARIFSQHSNELSNAIKLLCLQTIIVLIESTIDRFEMLITMKAQQKLKFYFEKLLIEKSARLPLKYFDRPDYYDQLERAAFGVEIKGFNIYTLILKILQGLITLISIVAIIVFFHWMLVIVVLLMFIPNLLVNFYIGKQKYRQQVQQTETQRKAHYLLNLLHSRNAAKELRVYDNVLYLISKWKFYYWKTASEKYLLEKRSSSNIWIVYCVNSIINFFIIGILILLGAKGALTIGQYVALTQAFGQIQYRVTDFGSNIAKVYEESLFVNELLNYLQLEEENNADKIYEFPDKIKEGIKIDNINFTYYGSEIPQLEGVSFTIYPGESIAIVGENGAGKSTLVKCLLGLYLPEKGRILFDGINIKCIDPKSLRKNVSAIFQDHLSYQMTFRENIAMGHEKMNNDSFVEAIAAKAGLADLIKKLPKGLNTELGPVFNGGYELSGGQWQKIALSRAFMRDAQIIILDEPTAALDPRSEEEVYNNLTELYKNKTTIMISHRLSSCKHADKIVVMEKGKVVEIGNHEELIELKGIYAELFQTQARRYSD